MSETERALEEERRIINAATDCEAEYYEGRSFNGLHEVRGVGNYNNDSSIAEDRFMIPADGKRLAHSWNALPLRNAQVAAVLAKCDEWQKEGEHWMEEWHKDESAENIPMLSHGAELVELARRVRRAIEEAGA